MSTSNLVNALFKIDAAEGLVRYVNAVKPYHSKILDVLIEYVYKEDLNVSIAERWTIDIHQQHTTGTFSWDATTGAFTTVPPSSTYRAAVNPAARTFTIPGHHTDKIRPGNRILVTHHLTTGQEITTTLIVWTVAPLSPVSPASHTVITVSPHHTVTVPADTDYTTITTAYTPDYRLAGIINTPTEKAWVIHGDQRDQFLPGERVMIAGLATTSQYSQYYTVSGTLTLNSSGSTIIPITADSILPSQQTPFTTIDHGSLRYAPTVFTQPAEPAGVLGAVWTHPLTNVSKRYFGDTGWQYEPSSPQHAWPQPVDLSNGKIVPAVGDPDNWLLGNVNAKKSLIVKSATKSAENDPTSNTFTVDITDVFQSYNFAAISTAANQFIFSRTHDIIGVDLVNNGWVVQGTVEDLIANETIYVSGSTGRNGNGRYVVTELSPVGPNNTLIKVSRRISRSATPDGLLIVPAQPDEVPYWAHGTRVRVSSSDTLPDPLSPSGVYYFIPVIKPFADSTIQTPPVFVLSRHREPAHYDDYVDITTLGSGTFTLTQDEVFVPGTIIRARDTYNARNNGVYTVVSTTNSDANTAIVHVAERIGYSTIPANTGRDGVIEFSLDSHYRSVLTDQHRRTTRLDNLLTRTQITEHIQFAFTASHHDEIAPTVIEFDDSYVLEQHGWDGNLLPPNNDIWEPHGWDGDQHSSHGWDGDLIAIRNGALPSSGAAGPQNFVHSVAPMGFDTQYFDIGAMDETPDTVTHYYHPPTE